MKKLLLFATGLLFTQFSFAQTTIWTENFDNGCASGCTTYTSTTNGAWTITDVATPGNAANSWYISESEVGFPAGECGQLGPAIGYPNATGASLHISAGNLANAFSSIAADPAFAAMVAMMTAQSNDAEGANYFSGLDATTQLMLSFMFPGFSADASTSKRAESPVINLTGKSSLEIKFNYIEGGSGTNDNATLWGYDGSTWAQIADMPKTDTCSTGKGEWETFTVALPAYFNNNPNAKIGFLWQNNSDGVGTDPSFAVDNIEIFTSVLSANFTASNNSICSSDSVTFTDASSGAATTWTWTFQNGTPATSNAQNPGAVKFTPGTQTVTLVVGDGTTTDTHTMQIIVEDAPVLTTSSTNATTGNNDGTATVNVSGGVGPFSYEWNTAPMQITQTATGLAPGTYTVKVSGTNGCSTTASITVYDENDTTQSVNEFSKAGMLLFPNPSADVIHIDVKNVKVKNAAIFNLLGQKMTQELVQDNAQIISFNVENYPAGIYLVQLTNDAKVYTVRFVKK